MSAEDFILPGTDEEQAIIDERIAEEMVNLAEHFPGAQADFVTEGVIGDAAVCLARLAVDQIRLSELGFDAPDGALPSTWPLAGFIWQPSADPRGNLAKAIAFLWLEAIRLERLAAGGRAECGAQKGGAA